MDHGTVVRQFLQEDWGMKVLLLLGVSNVVAWSPVSTRVHAARKSSPVSHVRTLMSVEDDEARQREAFGLPDPLQESEVDEARQREALRLPDPLRDTGTDTAWEGSSSRSEPDLFIPILTVGSFAGFALIILNEYVTRGFCPPFLSTCINLQDSGGWGA